ncbi:unnamed protein product [Clavelina lepadiformis]|uniref:Secreted protein n=1 Tax=Clavelina lepadiformis TaxID=159417 RepID=A0ABP0FHV1_CLALP
MVILGKIFLLYLVLVSSTLQRRVKACSCRFGSSDDSRINKAPMIHHTTYDVHFLEISVFQRSEVFILMQLLLRISGSSKHFVINSSQNNVLFCSGSA